LKPLINFKIDEAELISMKKQVNDELEEDIDEVDDPLGYSAHSTVV